MFVVVLQYVRSLDEVDRHLPAHREFLARQFGLGHFVASGAQIPRIGGVILTRSLSRPALDAILAQDPFYRERVAQYQVIEFAPSLFAPGAAAILDSPD